MKKKLDNKYTVNIETEMIGNRELAYLFISHAGNSRVGIKIKDPIYEIPMIIEALAHFLSAKCSQIKEEGIKK